MIHETLARLAPFCADNCAVSLVDGHPPVLLVKQGERFVAVIPLDPAECGRIRHAVAAPVRPQPAAHFVRALQQGGREHLGPTS